MKRIGKWLTWVWLTFATVSCAVDDKERATAVPMDDMYTALSAGDIDAALTFFSDSIYDTAALDSLRAAFNNNSALLGNLELFEGRVVQAPPAPSGEASRMQLVYAVTYTNGHATDSITLQREEDIFKIIAYTFHHTDAKYLQQIAQAEEQARAYLRLMANGKFGEAYEMVGYHGRDAATEKEWAMLLFDTSVAAGPVTSFKVQTDRSTLEVFDSAAAQPGYYYTIIAITTCTNAVVQENLLFYQPDYSSPVMLINHGRRVVQ